MEQMREGEVIMSAIKYAQVAWTIDDILSKYDCSEEEAVTFLTRYQGFLADKMVETGWEVIESLGAMVFAGREIDEPENLRNRIQRV